MSYHKAEQWEAVPCNLVWYIKVCLHWLPFWSPSLNCPNCPLSLQFGSESSQSTQPGFTSDTNQKIHFRSAPNILQPLTGIKVHRIKLELTQRKIPCSKHSLDVGTITYFILQIQSYCVTQFMLTETKAHSPTSSYQSTVFKASLSRLPRENALTLHNTVRTIIVQRLYNGNHKACT